MKHVLALFILFSSCYLWADDIARGVRGGDNKPDESDGGYLEMGFGLALYVDPFVSEDNEEGIACECVLATISGMYRYKGFFFELAAETADGISLGYNLWQTDTWSVDLLLANLSGDLDFEDTELPNKVLTEEQKDAYLLDRGRGYLGAGARITGYLSRYILQYRLVSDFYDNKGIMSSLRFGRNWQYRNWNFHTITSAEYYSTKTTNYFIGVLPEEATSRFPEYSTSGVTFLTVELGATYPVTEHWVARSFVRYAALTKRITRSPIIDENYGAEWVATLSYTF